MPPKKAPVQLCILCDKTVSGALKACCNPDCTDPYLVHELCLKQQMETRAVVTLNCDGCGRKDRYRKVEKKVFHRNRLFVYLVAAFLASTLPWFIATFTLPDRIAQLSTIQCIIFSWIISILFAFLAALLVMIGFCVAVPIKYVKNSVWPGDVNYELEDKAE